MKRSFTLKAFAFGAAASIALSAAAAPSQFIKATLNTTPQEPVFTLNNDKPEVVVPAKKMRYEGAVSTAAKAPAAKAAASYGDWETALPGTYTFVQTANKPTGVDYNYIRRLDTANEGEFQAKVLNWGATWFAATGVDLELTVSTKTYTLESSDGTSNTYTDLAVSSNPNGTFTGFQATGYPDGQAHDVYVFDRAAFYKAMQTQGETWSDGSEITDQQCDQWYALSGFDELTGKITWFPTYCLVVDGKVTWYTFSSQDETTKQYLTESYQMTGNGFLELATEVDTDNGYFSHEKDAKTGTFTVNYNIHDNNVAWFQVLTGSKTASQTTTALQALMEIAYKGTEASDPSVVKVTESTGTIALPVTNYRKGNYTIIYIAQYPGIEDGYYITGSGKAKLVANDLDYYTFGTATYTDETIYEGLPYVFGQEDTDDQSAFELLQELFQDELGIALPDSYTVTVPLQANSKVEGEYRLVQPYREYYNKYLADMLDYDGTNDFTYFSTAKYINSYIAPSTTGIYWAASSGNEYMLAFGQTNKMPAGPAASAEVWGTYYDNAVTFPAIDLTGVTTLDEVKSALSFNFADYDSTTAVATIAPEQDAWSQVFFYPEVCEIKAEGLKGDNASVEGIAADATLDLNAPVEYFNLQGIRVANPEAGQILIKRQGSTVTKLVIR